MPINYQFNENDGLLEKMHFATRDANTLRLIDIPFLPLFYKETELRDMFSSSRFVPF